MFITLHIHIAGTVQGVFFRSTTKGKADELNIKGWVRNCDDGSVEIIAQGKKGALRKFTEWCRHGTSSASVTKVLHEEMKSAKVYTSFEIRYK